MQVSCCDICGTEIPGSAIHKLNITLLNPMPYASIDLCPKHEAVIIDKINELMRSNGRKPMMGGF